MKNLSIFLGLILFFVARNDGVGQSLNCDINQELYKNLEFPMTPISVPKIPGFSANIIDFGAIPDGTTLCSEAISKCIEFVASKGGGRVIIPRGMWLSGPIVLKSNIELSVESGAVVMFSPDKSLYPLVETIFEGLSTFRCQSPISGKNLENIAITGAGVFDGSGDFWRPVKKEKLTEGEWKKLINSGGIVSENGKTWYPSAQYIQGEKMSPMNVPTGIRTKEDFENIRDFLRPVMVSLSNCKNVLLDGPSFQNSPAWCLHPLMCENLIVRNCQVRNPWYSQNGDGIDVESCKNALVYKCTFDVGDDAICIKSGKDKEGRDRAKPTENLVIKNCMVYHGHGGVTVGSEMSGGVRNLHVSGCTFLGTDVGLRFKSNRGRGGVVENVFISNISMMNIPAQAISFNLFYSGKSASEDLAGGSGKPTINFPVTDETPQFKKIVIKNIVCKNAFQAILLQGLPEMNLQQLSFDNIKMIATHGIICEDADQVKFNNIDLDLRSGYAVEIKNGRNITVDKLKCRENPECLFHIAGEKTQKLKLGGSDHKLKAEDILIEKDVDPKEISH